MELFTPWANLFSDVAMVLVSPEQIKLTFFNNANFDQSGG
jgi:hypothetical protein